MKGYLPKRRGDQRADAKRSKAVERWIEATERRRREAIDNGESPPRRHKHARIQSDDCH